MTASTTDHQSAPAPDADAVGRIMEKVREHGKAFSRYDRSHQHYADYIYAFNDASAAWTAVEQDLATLVRERDAMRAVVGAARAVQDSSDPCYVSFAEEEPEWVDRVSGDALNELVTALCDLGGAVAASEGEE